MKYVYLFLLLIIFIIIIAIFKDKFCSIFGDCECTIGAGTEIEARFLDVDPDKIREKLTEIGAKQIYEDRAFRRTAYALENGYARVRDEGDGQITMTVKKYNKDSKYPEEYE